jgi:hypothetical protein
VKRIERISNVDNDISSKLFNYSTGVIKQLLRDGYEDALFGVCSVSESPLISLVFFVKCHTTFLNLLCILCYVITDAAAVLHIEIILHIEIMLGRYLLHIMSSCQIHENF